MEIEIRKPGHDQDHPLLTTHSRPAQRIPSIEQEKMAPSALVYTQYSVQLTNIRVSFFLLGGVLKNALNS